MREALVDKRTFTIYPLPLDSGGGGGYKNMCRIKFYFIPSEVDFFWGGGGGDLGFFFFNEKGSKEKKVLLQDMQIFFWFLKLSFDRICIPPSKKDWGIVRCRITPYFIQSYKCSSSYFRKCLTIFTWIYRQLIFVNTDFTVSYWWS